MVKGVFCFVLVLAFAALATSIPLGPGNPVYVCSAPVGTSTGGSAFSDEAFYNPGSKVTAIKIRVGGEALDYIQAHYDGEAGPIHGGEDGPGYDVVFTVPEGTDIVAASGTISERWGYVESINFTTSDGEVHGPFGYNSGEAWTREGGEGHTLGFLKGISGDALDMLSLCWNPTGVDSVLLQPVTATQSSTHSDRFRAAKCIDGDTTGPDDAPFVDDTAGDMCHTLEEPTPWFAIDYGKTVVVNRVEIFNRAACCGNRTRNVDVRISDELPTSGSEMFSGGTLFGHFAGPAFNGQHIVITGQREMSGRYVIVQMNNGENTPLNLKEVKAFGKELVAPTY